MNLTLFKTPRFLVYIYYCKARYPEGHRPTAVLLNANHAIRTVLRGDAQLVLWYSSFRPPASVRDPACIRDPASIRTNEVWPPAFIRDSACIWDPASIRGNTVWDPLHPIITVKKWLKLVFICWSSNILLCVNNYYVWHNTFIAVMLRSDVKFSSWSLPRGQNFVLVLGLEYLSWTCPWAFHFGLVKLFVMLVLVIFLSLQWLVNCVTYLLCPQFFL